MRCFHSYFFLLFIKILLNPFFIPDNDVRGLEFEKFRRVPLVIAALHRIPTPGFLSPQRAVTAAVIGLLDETALVPMVQQIALRATAGKIANAGTGSVFHTQADLAVVEISPVALGRFRSGRRVSGTKQHESDEESSGKSAIQHGLMDVGSAVVIQPERRNWLPDVGVSARAPEEPLRLGIRWPE